jgi:hypothetical protein
VWHVKEPSLLKAITAKHSDNGDSRQIGEKIARATQNKQTKHTQQP